ncbi:MAG: photosynthetic complex putative assembly protein PuhB, partial [Xanthobacteraceae bacterium]
MSEYDIEPIPGLPQRPPAGEQILWQGSPRWQTLAIRVFHARKAAIYFAVIILWRIVSAVSEGDDLLAAATSALWLPPIALIAVGVLVALAWQTGRTTVYTITNRRVAMRFGIALPMTVNIPFRI